MPRPAENAELRVGNVYVAKGGNGPAFWLVVAIREPLTRNGGGRRVVVLGLDADGAIVSGSTYGAHVFDRSNIHFHRNLVGRVEDLESFKPAITWFATPI